MDVEFRLLTGAAVFILSDSPFEFARSEDCCKDGGIIDINAAALTIQCAYKTTVGQ